jgi:trehalose 6-phosphate phosphatase
MATPHAAIAVTVPLAIRTSFLSAKRALRALSRKYPHIKIENKGMSFALHYRRLTKAATSEFIREADTGLAPYVRSKHVRVIHDLSTYDIMPHSPHTKGSAAAQVLRTLRRKRRAVPIYIGDGKTDEDAFRMLRNGVTIRVGHGRESAARYWIATQTDVIRLLVKLEEIVGEK